MFEADAQNSGSGAVAGLTQLCGAARKVGNSGGRDPPQAWRKCDHPGKYRQSGDWAGRRVEEEGESQKGGKSVATADSAGAVSGGATGASATVQPFRKQQRRRSMSRIRAFFKGNCPLSRRLFDCMRHRTTLSYHMEAKASSEIPQGSD